MMKEKRAQASIEMSFGVIFSIFLIIAIIGVAVYVIIYFLGLGKCSEAGLFFEGMENKVREGTKVSTGFFSDSFVGNLPSGIEKVCFGNLSLSNVRPADSRYKDELLSYKMNPEGNVFLYPPKKACDGNLYSKNLERISVGTFFCVDVSEGKNKVIYLQKKIGENLVKVCDTFPIVC